MIHHHRITGTIAVAMALALVASFVPAANARPLGIARPNPDEQTLNVATVGSGPCSEVCSGGGYNLGSSPAVGSAVRPSGAAATPPTVGNSARSAGFEWGDAGVGAGGMLALIVIGAGGLTVARRHSHPVTTTVRPTPQSQD